MKRIRLLCLLIAALLAACSEDNPVDAGNVVVRVHPDVVRLVTGDVVTLHATVTGASDTTVTWSISFADGEAGDVLSDGRYVAPDTVASGLAIVIVRATSNAEPSAWSEAVIAIRNRSDTAAAAEPVAPGVGSGYVFSTYKLDSLKQKVPGSDETETYTVLRVGEEVDGKSNATVLLYRGEELPIAYESNGDLSLQIDGTWKRLPFGSRSSVLLEKFDTTYADGSRLSVSETATYSGVDSVVIAGRKLLTHRVTISSSRTSFSSSGESVSTATTDLRFAPAIGWFTRIDEWSVHNSSGTQRSQGRSSLLESYVVK